MKDLNGVIFLNCIASKSRLCGRNVTKQLTPLCIPKAFRVDEFHEFRKSTISRDLLVFG